ncbi:AAA family ATPase [Streptomyces albus]|uniref:KGGVGR-motif variant AAA ATPase n=1 Tax=Streptomyces albus TaxID=1888 RepID=UPI0033D81AF0
MVELTDFEGLIPPGHLFTWVDAEEHLADLASAGRWPRWLLAADGWWDALEIVVTVGTPPTTVRKWLDEVFGAGSTDWSGDTLLLRLDDPRSTSFTGMPVVINEAHEEPVGSRRLPLLREKHLTPQLAHTLPRPSDRLSGDVQLVAFHSFKGGVGRTVHAIAVADAIARRGGNVLLVDADLEAPGITWMHAAQGGQLDFCYEDLLALLQGAENDDCTPAVEIAAGYLPNQQAGRYPEGRLTIIPTSRKRRLGPPRIEPADLLTPGRSPYFVTEALASLAVRTGADAVVIDLRAGASELSAPVLLDPRVQRVFVTTLSHQSLAGTDKMLRQLGQRAPSVEGTDPPSAVIITQYRKEVHADMAASARESLQGALLATLQPDAEDDTVTDDTGDVDSTVFSQPLLSQFREQLLALPSSWNEVLDVLDGCRVAEALEPIIPTVNVATLPATGTEEEQQIDHDALRRRLADTANKLIYAEREGLSSASGFLVTEPLRRLLGDHRTEPPLALVVGAKGAGKTFLHSKACAAQTWERFAQESGIGGVSLTAPVVPVLESEHLEYSDLTPQDLRDAFAARHSLTKTKAATTQQLRVRLKEGLASLESQDDLGWRRIWLECLATAAGLPCTGQGGAEEALTELGQRARAVFVIDGLEDLLQSLDTEVKCTALRVLLIDVLAWLRSLRGHPLGLVVFVRQDLVRRAVRQNSDQLLSRYDSYALRWNENEALRLALWVTAHADAMPAPVPESNVSQLPADHLAETLIQVWGWKMGSAKSKEARSHLWVPAALGDFNGQVQARDVVAFLAKAAELSVGQKTWTDRVLAPTAMRKALGACSRLKIESIRQENQDVGHLLTQLQQVRHPVNVPFELESVGLNVKQAEFLMDSGVFARGQDGRYWVAEIYRHGLGFGSERRAKVLWRR